MPKEILDATEGYRSEMDTLKEFLEDCCEIDKRNEISVKALYERYKSWCEHSSETPLTKRVLGQRMSERNFCQYQKTSGNRERTWKGISIKGVEDVSYNTTMEGFEGDSGLSEEFDF